jgi:hypothetical protein
MGWKTLNNQDYINKYEKDNIILVHKFATAVGPINNIVNPAKIDNRQLCTPPDCQGDTPHCAGFSCANYIESMLWKESGIPLQLESSQIYAKAKKIDGMKHTNGTTPEAVLIAAMNLCGWSGRFQVKSYAKEEKFKTMEYVKFLIHKHSFLLCGFEIMESWYKCSNENYEITHSGNSLGGHCVLGCGYDQTGFYIQNSWGKKWGSKGFAIIPWDIFQKEFVYCCWMEKN